MGAYRGKALQAKVAPRRGGRLWRVLARAVALILVVGALFHVPWDGLRRRFAVISHVRIEGLRYLDADRVAECAELRRGDDLFRVDLAGARQRLLLDSRIASANLGRCFARGVRIRVRERVPALLVQHGSLWEIDSTGVLLQPLGRGVVADVPLLVGPSLEGVPAGTQVSNPQVARGLAWTHALSERALQLGGQVSELDVSHPDETGVTLLDGTRVVGPAWPPSMRRLSALRVVLADLKQKGTAAEEIDVRFENQVIVRPVALPEAGSGNG
jgi:cell division septal protein FtsQ